MESACGMFSGSSGYHLLRHPAGSICLNFTQSCNKLFYLGKITVGNTTESRAEEDADKMIAMHAETKSNRFFILIDF